MVIQPVLGKFRSRHPRPTIFPAATEHILCCSTDSQSLGPILPYLMHSVFFGFECSCSGWEYTTNSPAHSTKSTSSLGVLGLSCNSLSSLLWRSKTALYSTKQNLYQQKPLLISSLAPRFTRILSFLANVVFASICTPLQHVLFLCQLFHAQQLTCTFVF